MNYWLLQGNPDKFDVDRYLKQTNNVYWSVTIKKYKEEMRVGDKVFIWRSRGSKGHVYGVVAYGVISEAPIDRSMVKNKIFLYDSSWKESFSESSEIKVGVLLNEVRLTTQEGMLVKSVFDSDYILRNSRVIKVKTGSNFKLSEIEFKTISDYWNGVNDLLLSDDGYLIESSEGMVRLRLHKIRERNQKLVNSKKQKFLAKNGRLFCEICNFNFEDMYGELGHDFIEAHHCESIASLNGAKNSIENLKLVCSNCHSMIHRTKNLVRNLSLIVKKLKT